VTIGLAKAGRVAVWVQTCGELAAATEAELRAAAPGIPGVGTPWLLQLHAAVRERLAAQQPAHTHQPMQTEAAADAAASPLNDEASHAEVSPMDDAAGVSSEDEDRDSEDEDGEDGAGSCSDGSELGSALGSDGGEWSGSDCDGEAPASAKRKR
jgi:hypothetical protein